MHARTRYHLAEPQLWRTLATYFRLDAHQQRAVWQAVVHAKWTVPRQWRQAVELFEARPRWQQPPNDVSQFLAATLPPRRQVEVLEVLVHEGQLRWDSRSSSLP